jgi:hypothetical protein
MARVTPATAATLDRPTIRAHRSAVMVSEVSGVFILVRDPCEHEIRR